jgi:putative IMPACT (imprinted ancient) family translation regulator
MLNMRQIIFSGVYIHRVDRYVTLAGRSEARIKVERSEFLGIALPADDLDVFLGEFAGIEKKHFDATHHCWAYRPFAGPERSNDAGEPHGTAGKRSPMPSPAPLFTTPASWSCAGTAA